MRHTKYVQKALLSLAVALCLLTVTFGASAHAASVQSKSNPHTVNPNSTGGGCGAFKNSSSGDISVSACINYNFWSGETLNGDDYVTFRSDFSKGYISACYVQTLIISNHGQYPGAFLQQNCVISASNSASDAHFGVVSTSAWSAGDYANTYVNVKLTYSSGAVSVVNNVESLRIYM